MQQNQNQKLKGHTENVNFDIYYTDSKNNSINILVSEILDHLEQKYPYHFRVFTDGPVLDDLGV